MSAITYETSDFLAHFGVKGMKWGVRKEKETTSRASTSSIEPKIDALGAITLPKGAQLQRVVRRSDGVLFKKADDIGDVTYASFDKNDNLAYETMFGKNKNLFNKVASDVLTLTATQELRSPGPKESAELFFKGLKDNPAAFKQLNDGLRDRGTTLLYSKQTLKDSMANPGSRRAFDFYAWSFEKGNYDYAKTETGSLANKTYFNQLKKSGYNMLLDPSDSTVGVAQMPVIILDAKTKVKVSSSRTVTNQSRKAATKAYTKSVDDGKTFLEKLGYEL